MTKYTVLILIAPFLLGSTIARAETYEGKCLNFRLEEFKDCTISIDPSTIDLEFKREQYQTENLSIRTGQVVEIAAGEYAQQLFTTEGSIIGRILIGNAVSIGQLLYNRNDQQFVVQYINNQRERQATAILIDRDETEAMSNDLSDSTGMSIVYQPPEEETLVDGEELLDIDLPDIDLPNINLPDIDL
ncbi:MAG: hypothetical protein J7641_21175 [Cyanobacteria bacterium SID2]|nr:hypothetical protein [Cyanobacteria bacterium SID2]MBP0006378.1 hypothetical protein [Cyanobacteria bacterium SBC]